MSVTAPRSVSPMLYTSLKYSDSRAMRLTEPAPKKPAAHHVRRSERMARTCRKPSSIETRTTSCTAPDDSPRAGSRRLPIMATHTKVGRARITNDTRHPAAPASSPDTGPPNSPMPVVTSRYTVKTDASLSGGYQSDIRLECTGWLTVWPKPPPRRASARMSTPGARPVSMAVTPHTMPARRHSHTRLVRSAQLPRGTAKSRGTTVVNVASGTNSALVRWKLLRMSGPRTPNDAMSNRSAAARSAMTTSG